MNNVVIVSAADPSDSPIYIHVSIHPQSPIQAAT